MPENDSNAEILLGRSRVRQHILVLLFDHPDRRLHLRGVARAVGASAGTVARELGRLVDAGLVERSEEGRQVYFRANPESPLFDSVRTIIRRTIGAPEVIRRRLAGLEGLERVVLYGSYARGDATATSDIDLMIIGSPDIDELTDRVSAAEHELGRPLNYTILTEDELGRRRQRGDKFIASVEGGPIVLLHERAGA